MAANFAFFTKKGTIEMQLVAAKSKDTALCFVMALNGAYDEGHRRKLTAISEHISCSIMLG